ncbi:MAG: hypothetical protein LBF33_03205 [Oscillospiraceae bacterium]|jgi:hypothetical protein|nr:hypothetical protein [Oscillospiraceae bacterium]
MFLKVKKIAYKVVTVTIVLAMVQLILVPTISDIFLVDFSDTKLAHAVGEAMEIGDLFPNAKFGTGEKIKEDGTSAYALDITETPFPVPDGIEIFDNYGNSTDLTTNNNNTNWIDFISGGRAWIAGECGRFVKATSLKINKLAFKEDGQIVYINGIDEEGNIVAKNSDGLEERFSIFNIGSLQKSNSGNLETRRNMLSSIVGMPLALNSSYGFSPEFRDLNSALHLSHLYSKQFYPQVVMLHKYDGHSGFSYGAVADIILNNHKKGVELLKDFGNFMNVNALPPDLRDFLFQSDAPFEKLRFQVVIQRNDSSLNDPLCLRPHYAIANMPGGGKHENLLRGVFAIRVYGAEFLPEDNEASPECSSNFDRILPKGFSLKEVNTHSSENAECWIASPNNCRIKGTELGDNKSVCFFSVVLGNCMQHLENYEEDRRLFWESKPTAIVTLHVVASSGIGYTDVDILRESLERQWRHGGTFSDFVGGLHAYWQHRFGSNSERQNPFSKLNELFKTN